MDIYAFVNIKILFIFNILIYGTIIPHPNYMFLLILLV